MNAPAPTFIGPRRPFFARFLNGAGALLQGAGLTLPRLDLPGLLESTPRSAELNGPDDAAFMERFRTLIEDARGPGELNAVGRLIMRDHFAGILQNRLRIRDALRQQPEIAQVPLASPLFVVGHPRTGTSLLYNLLALDPQARAPLYWELTSPAPPPDPRRTTPDPRRGEAERLLKRHLSMLPALMSVHELAVDAPDECYHLLENSAFSPTFLFYFEVPTYWRRLMSASAEETRQAYEEYRRQIQILQFHRAGTRWVSKAPAHLYFLEALLRAVPEGHVLCTHRDPMESIPSLCSLMAILRTIATDPADMAAVGRATLATFLKSQRRSDEARAAVGDRVIDLSYRDLTSDPIGTLRKLYDRLRLPFTPEFEAKLRSFMAQHPQHQHGVHRYSLEQFGLEREHVLRATRDYREKYL